jgi:NAD-dependent deacetylase
MPEKELQSSSLHALSCDLMIVLGSSLVVNPAASLVALAIKNGARSILINAGETPYDQVVTLRLHNGIGELLPPAVAIVKQALSIETEAEARRD